MKAYYQVTQKQKPQTLTASDEEAIAWLVKQAKKSEAKAREFVANLRQYWRERGVSDRIKMEFC